MSKAKTIDIFGFPFELPLTIASSGYLLAKRQMQELLDNKVCQLRRLARIARTEGRFTDMSGIMIEVDSLERLRDYVRNTMLWNTKHGK